MAPQAEEGPVPGMVVEGIEFPPVVTSPISGTDLVLAGAGVRTIPINSQLTIKVTCLGLYLDPKVVDHVSAKYGGKTSDELVINDEFYDDLISAPFEKLMRVTMLKPLPGVEFARKVMENTKAGLQKIGGYGPEEEQAIEKFTSLCKDQVFSSGGGPIFLFAEAGLSLAFSQNHGEVTPVDAFCGVFGNSGFAQAILATMIGKNAVTPATKASIAETLAGSLRGIAS